MNSIISWVGGKKALRDLIYLRMPREYGRYIEVFVPYCSLHPGRHLLFPIHPQQTDLRAFRIVFFQFPYLFGRRV